MKTKYLLFFLFFSICTYSQTMTEKYNSYLNRYEYFDSSGNLTGYKTYNSYLGVWEYFNENTNTYNKKPIQYAKPPTDDNFALLQQVANQKQNSYNSNLQLVKNAISNINSRMDKDFDMILSNKMKNQFFNEYVKKLNYQKNDYSSSATTQNVINWLNSSYIEMLQHLIDTNGQ
nr:hypothetical protein [uncultured Flavobacterium sp.]